MSLELHARDISRHLVQSNAVPFSAAATGFQQEKVFADASAWLLNYLEKHGAVFTSNQSQTVQFESLNTHSTRG